jgi:hypothetical protein
MTYSYDLNTFVESYPFTPFIELLDKFKDFLICVTHISPSNDFNHQCK